MRDGSQGCCWVGVLHVQNVHMQDLQCNAMFCVDVVGSTMCIPQECIVLLACAQVLPRLEDMM
jgi:hypothetical protein